MITPSHPKPREGAFLWSLKLIGGLLIVLLLGLHFVVNHLIAPDGLLNYDEVLAYYQNPIIPIIEIAFLIFVVIHALLGMRSIILDLNPTPRFLSIIDRVFILAGFGAIIYGTWLAIHIVQLGK